VSDSVGLHSHESSDSTLRTSSGLHDSSSHWHDYHSNDSNMRLHLLHHCQTLSLHSLESVEADIDSIEVSSALFVLASFHSSGHVLFVSSDMSFSSLRNSDQESFAHLHNSGKHFLVSSSHLLQESGSVL